MEGGKTALSYARYIRKKEDSCHSLELMGGWLAGDEVAAERDQSVTDKAGVLAARERKVHTESRESQDRS